MPACQKATSPLRIVHCLEEIVLDGPRSIPTFISTHRWDTWNFASHICNVLIDACVALCRQSEETLCNILLLDYRESKLHRNELALHWNCCYVTWHATPLEHCAISLLLPQILIGHKWHQQDWVLPFWSHFELISVSGISSRLEKSTTHRQWQATQLLSCPQQPPFGNFTVVALGTRNKHHIPSWSMEALARKYFRLVN
jgi:hypothetical protein